MIVDFGEINSSLVGQTLNVGGFVHSIRDHGGLIFIDLRSESDLLQCVIDPTTNRQAFDIAETIHNEYVLQITGRLKAREPETINPNLATGEVELEIAGLQIVSQAKPMPFDIHAEDQQLAGEETRLKYRYLDLRRKKLKHMLYQKHKLTLAVRNWFDSQGFLEVQTPILANSSPEGARDYLVPSRLHPGKFYALPQAPQQFKQLLMVGGFTKYFQIAPCFRDEDPRSDRHPGDFYQIDAEIAWADKEDILQLNQTLIDQVLVGFSYKKYTPKPMTRLSYDQAMSAYGSDKPDLRTDLAWTDAKDLFRQTGFSAFAQLCDQPEALIQALVIPNSVDKFSRSDFDRIQDIGRRHGLPGIAYIQYFAEEEKSPIFKFFGDEATIQAKKQHIRQQLQTKTGDVVLFIANSNRSLVFKAQHEMRMHVAEHLQLIDHDSLSFVWVEDFPFFEVDDKTGKLDFGHNPFSMWEGGVQALQEFQEQGKLPKLKALQYDIACNGFEVLSGGVRNPNPEALMAAFKLVGYTEEEVRHKFRHMLEAYAFGAPNHAGFAWGLDRLFMVLTGEENIREVIAFPKNGSGMDVMLGSPMSVADKQLAELNLRVSD